MVKATAFFPFSVWNSLTKWVKRKLDDEQKFCQDFVTFYCSEKVLNSGEDSPWIDFVQRKFVTRMWEKGHQWRDDFCKRKILIFGDLGPQIREKGSNDAKSFRGISLKTKLPGTNKTRAGGSIIFFSWHKKCYLKKKCESCWSY